MSSAEPMDTAAQGDQSHVSEPPPSSRKSYRRKYRKIMVNFEEKMRESSTLFREEQRIIDISQRLAEQTDQILQLLVELNSRPQIPRRLRYDLKPPTGRDETVASSALAIGEEDGHLELRRARAQLKRGDMTSARYREIEAALLATPEFAPGGSYASLISMAPSSAQSADKGDSKPTVSSGFLSTKQEEQYLESLDAFLEHPGSGANPRAHAASNLGNRNAERNTERERETQLKNPVSVYNWLRKHQPQVFLQDNEPTTEKPPRATGSRSSARKSANKEGLKQEPDFYDEDGIATAVGSSARGKRKRDKDGGYRPKGGSARGTKRRRETREDSGRSKRAKKLSMDAR